MLRGITNAYLSVCISVTSVLAHGQIGATNTQRSAYDCHVDNLPTSWRFDDPPGTIEAHHVRFGELGQTSIDLRFRNGQAIPIQALALVVDYLDAKARIIDRVPLVAAVNSTSGGKPPHLLSPANTWKNALSQNDSEVIVAVADGIRTGICPARAEVTFAHVQSNNGSVQTFSSPGWRLGPTPAMIPATSRTAPRLPVDAPASLLAKLKINASGEVIDVAPEESADPKLVEWVRGQMGRNWKFHPALLNGRPTDSELSIEFLIYAKGMTEFPDVKPLMQPITVIRFIWSHDLFPQGSAVDRLAVVYGSLLEGSIPSLSFEEFVSTN